jgi:hypothetical protein
MSRAAFSYPLNAARWMGCVRQRLADHPEADFVYFNPAITARGREGGQQHATAPLIIEQDVMARGRAPEQGIQ